MNSGNTLSITEARNNFFKITDRVQKSGDVFTLTERGRPKVVIMSVDEFDSWQETLEIMSDSELMTDIKDAKKDFKKGDYITLEEVLLKENFIMADKPAVKYASSRVKKNSSKKSGKN